MCIKIITDSACDLPSTIIDELDITLMPLLVYVDDVEYKDMTTIRPEFMYQKMREGSNTTTSQLSIMHLKEVFTNLAKKNESCIYIAFSSGLSGTYQTAVMVKQEILEEYPDFDLEIIDSKCASLGFGMVVHKAALLAKEGKTKQEILSAIDFYCKNVEHIFTVDDLDYLAKGGRVSKTAAFLGGMLNIKPILDVEDGKLIPFEKIRGKKKLIKKMVDLVGQRCSNLENQTIYISHADDIECADKIKSLLQKEYNCNSFIVSYIGCAIGSHTGPGCLAIFALNKEYKNA